MTASLAALHDAALLDLDGVVYVGHSAVPNAAEAIASARAAGMAFAFVTNNASRPPEEVAAHLVSLGVPAAATDVVTSAQAGAGILARRLPPHSPVLAVGGPGVVSALRACDLTPVRPGDAAAPQAVAVLQGFGRDVSWHDLTAAALAVQRGAMWVLTNPDLTLPVEGGRAPGNGSLARAVEEAAGRGPDAIAGKPHPALMEESIARVGARTPLAVGDRLDTDIEGARRAGMPSLLVLTGIADIAGVLAAGPQERPDFLGADLTALLRPPAATTGPLGPAPDGDGWSLGSARARVTGGMLEVHLGDHGWLPALQTACAAAWSAPAGVDLGAAASMIERARRTVEP